MATGLDRERFDALFLVDLRTGDSAAAEAVRRWRVLGFSVRQVGGPAALPEALQQEAVAPGRAFALAGTQEALTAARTLGFGGVADLTSGSLRELRWGRPARSLPPPPQDAAGMAELLQGRRPVFFLDYDGTLAPIAPRPDLAVLSEEMRRVLDRLSRVAPVAVISGRDRKDVESLVGLDHLYYAGSHGFDIAGPGGWSRSYAVGEESLPELDRAEQSLRNALRSIEGALVERKRFSIAVHYRLVAPAEVSAVEAAVDEAFRQSTGLRRGSGKKLFELQPDLDWDKGRAVEWLLDALGVENALAFYLGDDTTDEDAFAALLTTGVGIVVGRDDRLTAARYALADPAEVLQYLRQATNSVRP